MGESPAIGLSASLRSAGFKLGRLQTGTPARLYKRTINFDQLAVQRGDDTPTPFSYLNTTVDNAVCNVTRARSSLNSLAFTHPRIIKFIATKLSLTLKHIK